MLLLLTPYLLLFLYCYRSDDDEEKFKHRLSIYKDQAALMEPIFDDILVDIDGNGNIDATWDKIQEHLKIIEQNRRN